ncbi:MAG TPA: VOC family protein [Bryobacteraceae bacterium]|nr:VOC family protein [Bryobacteraceae bacterium]
MTNNNSRQLFVNLAVRNLNQSKEFFGKLGFAFNPKFTDDNAACMIVNEVTSVMLLKEPFFKTFTRKEICDTTSHNEGLFALSCDSRAAVDDTVNKALAAGGKHAMDPADLGFMYSWSFYDLDGHHWEVLWMDPNAAPPH